MTVLQHSLARIRRTVTHDIWNPDVLGNRSLRGRSFAVLRVISMTFGGLVENALVSRAAALCFSSMLGLGPLVALIVLVSGVLLGSRDDPDFAVNQLNRALVFIAPHVRQFENVTQADNVPPPAADGAEASGAVAVNPDLVNLLNNFIKGSQSKALGVFGALALVFIVIQLFTSIENAFNNIWGVKRGRNWMLRIVFYWAAVTLGAVIAFAALAMMSAATFVNIIESIPLGTEIRKLIVWAGPFTSGIMLIGILSVFYKFIPNTTVNWWPAITGAMTVVILLYLNNLLAFIYLRQVVVNQSLFGSLAFLPILMIGLYIFWLFVLVGGQITYAAQNANYRSSLMAWHDLNYASRQGLGLLVLTLISRRFRNCHKPFNVQQISEMIKIPTQILNACLSRLIQLDLVTPLPADDNKAPQGYRYQPARPLSRMTLATFKKRFDSLGAGPDLDILDSLDPIVRRFHELVHHAVAEALGDETLEALIEKLPVESESGLAAPGSAPAS